MGSGIPGDPGDGRGGNAIDNHDWMLDPDWAEKMAEAIDKLNDDIDKQGKLPQDVRDKMQEEANGETDAQKALDNSMRAGSEEGNIREFQEKHGLSMAWAKLLKEVDPMIFKEPGVGPPPRAEWHKRPRKLGAFRDVNLPVYGTSRHQEKRSKEKKSIVLALDYSGSCGPEDADKFASLAKSIPQERIKVLACTFTTTWKKHDIENPLGGGNGGTDFNAIADFIEKEVRPELNGQYPTAVVVITDGQASFTNAPQGKEAEAWLWLLSPDRTHGYPASKNIGRWAMLDEYTL
jgi:predicted metal-dependent peptidase